MIALIDVETMIYRIVATCEDKVVWNEAEVLAGLEEPDVEYTSDLELCKEMFTDALRGMLKHLGLKKYVLVLSGDTNFRFDVLPTYKHNRDGKRTPLNRAELTEYVLERFNTIKVDNMEADDYVVYLKTKYPDKYFLCAVDKDVLKQTVGDHYNYNAEIEVSTAPEEALKYQYKQCLMGDTTDGYTGCPSIGTKKADRILAGLRTPKEMWSAVVAAYESKGLSEDDAIQQMRVASMHQFDGEKIVLFTPPE